MRKLKSKIISCQWCLETKPIKTNSGTQKYCSPECSREGKNAKKRDLYHSNRAQEAEYSDEVLPDEEDDFATPPLRRSWYQGLVMGRF